MQSSIWLNCCPFYRHILVKALASSVTNSEIRQAFLMVYPLYLVSFIIIFYIHRKWGQFTDSTDTGGGGEGGIVQNQKQG